MDYKITLKIFQKKVIFLLQKSIFYYEYVSQGIKNLKKFYEKFFYWITAQNVNFNKILRNNFPKDL